MDVHDYIHGLAVKARAAAADLARFSTDEKNAALLRIADRLEQSAAAIFAANRNDVENAKAAGLKDAMVDRLTLTEARFKAMVEGVRSVARLPDPVGEELWRRERPSGITIRKVRVPFGVVAVVFESRPNVLVDTAALCLKTGNAIILRGGKEALATNTVLAKVVREGLGQRSEVRGQRSEVRGQRSEVGGQRSEVGGQRSEVGGQRSEVGGQRSEVGGQRSEVRGQRSEVGGQRSEDSAVQPSTSNLQPSTSNLQPSLAEAVQFVEILDHAAVTEMVRAVGLIDVAIPRGGERLIRAMCEAALIPVLKHYKGVCHIYVDDTADLAMALSILDNAKTQRPGVCNAAECLLVHEKLAPLFLPMVEAWAKDKGVTLHGVPGSGETVDWEREFLALEMNVGLVKDYRTAIGHINRYGSHHSDCIVTLDETRAREFLRDVDSAAVYHNVSTRFTDGAEFGMGAEIGISTDKLHARGPMGLEELTTYKYQVTGDGVIRKG